FDFGPIVADRHSLPSMEPSILVVDDDEAVLKSTLRMLDSLGYSAMPAESGMKALDLLASHADIALVLADFAMPELNGVELARTSLKKYPAGPVILMSS